MQEFALRNKVSSEIHKLRKMDSGQMMASTNKCGASVNMSNSTASLVSNLPHDNYNSSVSDYLLTSPQTALNMSHLNSEEVTDSKYSREIFVEKNSKLLTESPVIVQPAYSANTRHKFRTRNVRNVYSTANEIHSRTNSHGSSYDSDISEDNRFVQGTYKPSNHTIHSATKYAPYSPAVISKITPTPSVQMFPIHPTACKNSCFGYKGAYSSPRTNDPVYPHFQSTLEIGPKQSPPLSESLTIKQRQLDETTEQLRVAKKVVKRLEEEAQVKTWQALKEQEAILKEKEESLKYREIMAQKKYEEAVRLLDKFRKLPGCERMKDKQSVGIHNKTSLHDDSVSVNSRSDKEQIQYFNSHDLNKKLAIHLNPFSQSEVRTFSSENQSLSDTSVGMMLGHSFSKRTQSKSTSKVGGRKPKKNYLTLNMCEVKPSIEPAKILRTYSRKSSRRECIPPIVSSSSSPSYSHSNSIVSSAQTDAIDVPVSTVNFKERVLVNESGTITITQLPKFNQPIRPCSKRKSDRYYPLTSVSQPLKKCPSRIDSDTSPYSSSSDLSGSFTEKVEKLTSSTNIHAYAQSYRTNRNSITGDLGSISEASKINQSVASETKCISSENTIASETKCISSENTIASETKCISSENTKTSMTGSESCEVKIENTGLKKTKSKGRLSMVTLQGVSFPSHSDATILYMNEDTSKIKGCDPLHIENSKYLADMESASSGIMKIIVPNYKTEEYESKPLSISQKDIFEGTSSENHCFTPSRIAFQNKSHSKDFNSHSSSSQNCADITGKNADSEIQAVLDVIMPEENCDSQRNQSFIQSTLCSQSSNSQTPIKSPCDLTSGDLSQSEAKVSPPPLLQNAPQSSKRSDGKPVDDQNYYSTDKPSSTNVESVYISSHHTDDRVILREDCERRFQGHTAQNNNVKVDTQSWPTGQPSVVRNSYGKVDSKENVLFFPKNSACDISVSQPATLSHNQGISSHLSKLDDEHIQPFSKIFKLQAFEESLHPVPDKPAVYTEGLQINNIQNIIFDVKNINQTSFSFSPDKRSTSQKSNSDFPSNMQTVCSTSPFIHYDQRLMQCIINNTDQTIYYTPTIVYTSPTPNLLNSYATNTISFCPSSIIFDENLSRICTGKTSTTQIKTDECSNLINVEKKYSLCKTSLVSDLGSSKVLRDLDDGSVKDSQSLSNQINDLKEIKIGESETDTSFTLIPSKVNFIENNLSANISENSTEDESLLDRNTKTSSILTPSITACMSVAKPDDREAWLNKSKNMVDFEDETGIDKLECAPEKENLNTYDNSFCSSDVFDNIDNERASDIGEPFNKPVCISSKGGRILKLKEWWSDIITESVKKSAKSGSERRTRQKILPEIEKETNSKRKRGRPRLKKNRNLPIKKIREKEVNYVSSENISCFWDTHVLPPTVQNYTSFECGKCNEVLTSVEEFKMHAFRVHSGLARLKGESQEFEGKPINKILKVVFSEQNFLHCDACGKDYKSVLGFQYHRKTCKILNQNTCAVCNSCGKLLLKTHPHSCDTLKKSENENDKKRSVSDDIEHSGRKRRKAAKFCHDQMKLLYSGIGLENDSDDKDFEEELKLKRYFSPKLDLSLDSSEIEKFIENLHQFGESSCINVGCEISFSSLKKLKTHLQNSCPKSEKFFKCKICSSILKEATLMGHLEKKHSDCMSDTDDTVYTNKTDDRLKHSSSPHSRPFVPAKQMTLEFRSINYSRQLYPELTCQSSEWVEIKDITNYLYKSKLQFSPLFKIQKNSSKNVTHLWERLDTFSGKKVGLGEILFAGGPIRSAAWCPVPFMDENASQYIALASVSNPDEIFPINKSLKHKGIIQIWDCGDLVTAEKPTLALCIGHEYGVAWSLEWCPSGIYESPYIESASQDSSLNRLGFIAAGFSDGSIRLYLIPHPYQIKSKSKFFDKVPEFSLLPYNDETMDIQCLKVSWCASKGHSLIAGSFTNGMVCIWDLTSTSPLLNVKNENGYNILYPINSIPAHTGVCSTVSFCPRTEGQHIVTGGNDRTIKFWDLTQPEQPITMIKKGIVTDSVWLPHWAGSFISFDDVFSLTKTSTTFRENGFHGATYRPVLGTNATVWSIAGSEWLNALVQGDEAGEVMVSKQTRLTCEISNEKFMSKRRYPVFSIRLENLKDGKVLSLGKDYQSKGAVPHKQRDTPKTMESGNLRSNDVDFNLQEFKEQPLTFSEAVEMYGLKICDEEYTSFSKVNVASIRAKQFSELMEPGPLTMYPLMGASSIAWNNNWGSHSWIFVGLNSGLGRIIRLTFLETDK